MLTSSLIKSGGSGEDYKSARTPNEKKMTLAQSIADLQKTWRRVSLYPWATRGSRIDRNIQYNPAMGAVIEHDFGLATRTYDETVRNHIYILYVKVNCNQIIKFTSVPCPIFASKCMRRRKSKIKLLYLQ